MTKRSVHRQLALAAALTATLVVVPGAPSTAAPGAVETEPGCTATSLSPGIDAVDEVPLGFAFEFAGQTHSSAYVHEDGFVTFGGPGPAFADPAAPLVERATPIIAPLLSDGDRVLAESEVTYGQTTRSGQPAFCVNWSNLTQVPVTDPFGNPGPDPLPGDPTNLFQMVLVDRSDIAPGNTEIIFNYDRIEWAEDVEYQTEPAPARAGWSSGNPLLPDTNVELPGSGGTRRAVRLLERSVGDEHRVRRTRTTRVLLR